MLMTIMHVAQSFRKGIFLHIMYERERARKREKERADRRGAVRPARCANAPKDLGGIIVRSMWA